MKNKELRKQIKFLEKYLNYEIELRRYYQEQFYSYAHKYNNLKRKNEKGDN